MTVTEALIITGFILLVPMTILYIYAADSEDNLTFYGMRISAACFGIAALVFVISGVWAAVE